MANCKACGAWFSSTAQDELCPTCERALKRLNGYVVPVVRCKDCKHRVDDVHCPMCFEEEIEWDDDGYTEVDYVVHDRTTDDGFCDRGERRTDDAEN